MFLTRECDYGIRVTRALADMEIRSVRSICDMENIPLQFAYKILKKMERAGIVISRRGAAGGYRLSKPPESFTLFNVVNAIDERLFINDCLQPGFTCSRNMGGNNCNVHGEFTRIQRVLMDALSEKTIKDLG